MNGTEKELSDLLKDISSSVNKRKETIEHKRQGSQFTN